MADELISVSEIAKLHSRHRAAVHKIIGRLGIETHLFKSDEARGQKATFISRSDYDLLLETLEAPDLDGQVEDGDSRLPGYFYIVQLEPIFDAGRFKLGFATSIEERVRKHRTSAPFAVVLKCWPSKLLWEKTAIDCIAIGCEKLHTEVFRTCDIAAIVARAESFFGLMPSLDLEPATNGPQAASPHP